MRAEQLRTLETKARTLVCVLWTMRMLSRGVNVVRMLEEADWAMFHGGQERGVLNLGNKLRVTRGERVGDGIN